MTGPARNYQGPGSTSKKLIWCQAAKKLLPLQTKILLPPSKQTAISAMCRRKIKVRPEDRGGAGRTPYGCVPRLPAHDSSRRSRRGYAFAVCIDATTIGRYCREATADKKATDIV